MAASLTFLRYFKPSLLNYLPICIMAAKIKYIFYISLWVYCLLQIIVIVEVRSYAGTFSNQVHEPITYLKQKINTLTKMAKPLKFKTNVLLYY